MASMRQLLSIPPATHQQGWWPTPRWALRRLAMYAIAALSGSLLVVLSAALLAIFSPREIPISPAKPPENRSPAAPSDTVIQTSPLVSQATASVKLIAFRQLLENKDNDPQAIERFITEAKLQQKYPLGFALFYSDSRKLLYYGRSNVSGMSFDPTMLKITVAKIAGKTMYCMNILPVKINGNLFENVQNNCFGEIASGGYAVIINGIAIDIEPWATSSKAAAWVVGMKPLSRPPEPH
jgi:hypothetical protein